MWVNFSICVWGRERRCVCVSPLLCFIFHHRRQERQIKKLYSNWYDQAEHLSRISNIKIRQLTTLGNKAEPISPKLRLICWELGRSWMGLDAPLGVGGWSCTIWRVQNWAKTEHVCTNEKTRHISFFFNTGRPRKPRCRLITVDDRRYQKTLPYKKPQSIKQFCLQQTHFPFFSPNQMFGVI